MEENSGERYSSSTKPKYKDMTSQTNVGIKIDQIYTPEED